MSFEESPSLDEYKDGLHLPPAGPSARQRRVRVVLLVAFLFVLLLSVANFFRSPLSNQLLGTGAVTGVVLDAQGLPFHGEVLVLGTNQRTQTALDGSFRLGRVPSGIQSLVILDEQGGNEIRIQLAPGQTLDLGAIRFTGTAIPGG